MNLSRKRKWAGILEPVFAIRTESDLGIGDTGSVRQMIDWCHRHGLAIFQTLPINETNGSNSPYNAISSIAIDPATIAISPTVIPDLSPQKFAKIARPKLLQKLRRGSVKYAEVKALKRALLEAAFDRFATRHFLRRTARARRLLNFLKENAAWLPDYTLFRALMEENGNSPAWPEWPPEHQTPAAAREWISSLPKPRRERLERKQLFFAYVQLLAFTQWQALKTHASRKGVFLMGDVAFGVARQSADVWANRQVFDLDWSGGAPPEKFFKVNAFTAKWGQNWGIATYHWEEMRRRDFAWWRARIDSIRKIFHLYRIDHALGFFRIYSFPWPPERDLEFMPLTRRQAAARTGGRLPGFKALPDDTPAHRAANQKHGEELLRFVLDASGPTQVVAEDLGLVPDYVPPTLRKLKIPGFRIPQFLRERDGRYTNPARYPRLSLTQPASHDHPPLAEVWREHWRNIDAGKNATYHRRELRAWTEFAGLRGETPPREYTPELREGYLRAVLQSNSWLVVVMITDVFGQRLRFNTPGAAGPQNWTARLPQTVKELDEIPSLRGRAKAFTRLARESGRSKSHSGSMSLKRLRLETLKPTHAKALFKGLSDRRLYRFIDGKPPVSLESLRERYTHLAARKSPDGLEVWLNWAVCALRPKTYIGFVQATLRNDGWAEVAFVLFYEWWGRGFGREAVAAMLEKLRSAYSIRNFSARVDPRNRRSGALLEALGFRPDRSTSPRRNVKKREIKYIL